MKIHHIGYLVKKIDKSIPLFNTLGYELTKDVYYDAVRKSHICFMENGGITIELVCPERDSDIYPLLKKYVNTPYHICYAVEHIDTAIAALTNNGWLLFKDKAPAPAISDTAEVAFLMHTNAGIIELVAD